MARLDAQHGEQSGPPYEWGVARIGGDPYVVRDVPEGMAEIYRVVETTRNMRVLAQADTVLFQGKVLTPKFEPDYKGVDFYHDHGGRMRNFGVDSWLRRPAHVLEKVHIATHLLDYPDSNK